MSNWKTPKVVLHGRKLVVGEVLVPSEIGMEPHPQYGVLPTLTVTKVSEDGKLLEGTAKCQDCDEVVVVHAGDWFQKRRCPKCQKRNARKSAGPTEAEKAAKAAAREATKAAKAAAAAVEKAAKAAARDAAKAAKAEAKAAEAKAKAEAKLAQLAQ